MKRKDLPKQPLLRAIRGRNNDDVENMSRYQKEGDRKA